MSDDTKFIIGFVIFLVVLVGGFTSALINADSIEWHKDGENCYTNIHHHNSWHFNDYTTIDTYCLKEDS